METSLVETVNSFAATLSDPRLTTLLTELCQRIEALELENKKIRKRITELEDIQDNHTETINNQAAAINKVWAISKRSVVPKGQKTKQRLEKLDQILKTKGARTLSQLDEDLGILPQEMSRLIAKLDMRRYDLFTRDGERREKVLRLRSRI
jgi:regulator of replication initiation timing